MLQHFVSFILGGFVIGFLWGIAERWDRADRKGSVRTALRYGLWGALLGLIGAAIYSTYGKMRE